MLRRGTKVYSNQADASHNPALDRKVSNGPVSVKRMVTITVPSTHAKINLFIWLLLREPERVGNPAASYSLPYFIIRSQK